MGEWGSGGSRADCCPASVFSFPLWRRVPYTLRAVRSWKKYGKGPGYRKRVILLLIFLGKDKMGVR